MTKVFAQQFRAASTGCSYCVGWTRHAASKIVEIARPLLLTISYYTSRAVVTILMRQFKIVKHVGRANFETLPPMMFKSSPELAPTASIIFPRPRRLRSSSVCKPKAATSEISNPLLREEKRSGRCGGGGGGGGGDRFLCPSPAHKAKRGSRRRRSSPLVLQS